MTVGLAQIADPSGGVLVVAVDFGVGLVYDVTDLAAGGIAGLIGSRQLNDPRFLGVLQARVSESGPYPVALGELLENVPSGRHPYFLLPFLPPEVWGVGVSYRHAAELHEADLQAVEAHATRGLYDYVFASERPEIFFKGLARHCVGHNQCIGIRGDSSGTMVEAELACVYDATGSIVAFTIANDVTAWDIERESPLFLTYAKVFQGSCAIGPCVVPAALVQNPLALQVRCRIERLGAVIYETEGNTANMRRGLGELTRYLCAYNPVPDGTLLCTGTAVGIPNWLTIESGDRITISCPDLGTLSNTAAGLLH